MCDCYSEPCKSCGRLLPLHLGGFITSRLEIAVVCSDCLRDLSRLKELGYPAFPYIIWYSQETGLMLIFSLTKNARRHRDSNYPNIARCIMVKEKIPYKANYSKNYSTDEEANYNIFGKVKDGDFERLELYAVRVFWSQFKGKKNSLRDSGRSRSPLRLEESKSGKRPRGKARR